MTDLGKLYQDGEVIIRQGEAGDCMYVIQKGTAHIIVERDGAEVLIRTCRPGEIVGEMALFEHEVRCATVRANGPVRALTVDKRTFMERVHADPSLAFKIVRTLSQRIRELTDEVARLMGES